MARVGNPPYRTKFLDETNNVGPVWQRWISNLTKEITHTQILEVLLTPSSIAADTVERQTFTVEGLITGDVVVVNPPDLASGLEILNYRVTDTETLQITFWNTTGSPIDPGEQSYLIVSIRA